MPSALNKVNFQVCLWTLSSKELKNAASSSRSQCGRSKSIHDRWSFCLLWPTTARISSLTEFPILVPVGRDTLSFFYSYLTSCFFCSLYTEFLYVRYIFSNLFFSTLSLWVLFHHIEQHHSRRTKSITHHRFKDKCLPIVTNPNCKLIESIWRVRRMETHVQRVEE